MVEPYPIVRLLSDLLKDKLDVFQYQESGCECSIQYTVVYFLVHLKKKNHGLWTSLLCHSCKPVLFIEALSHPCPEILGGIKICRILKVPLVKVLVIYHDRECRHSRTTCSVFYFLFSSIERPFLVLLYHVG